MYVYKWIEQPKQVQPRASHRHLSPTLLFISFEMLMALAKNSMNNLENVKLDEMELAILSRNICQWKPSRLCWNDEEIGVSKSNKTSKHVCNNRYKHFWAHLWCFTELNCISYHIILVIPPIPFMNLHILWTILDRRQKCSIFSLDHKLNACSKCITYMSSWSPEMVVYR